MNVVKWMVLLLPLALKSGYTSDAVRFAPRTDDGNESFRGQMEVSVDGRWAGICNISSATASVLCRQLHCAGGRALVLSQKNVTEGVFHSFSCNGRENRLSECESTRTHYCNKTSIECCPVPLSAPQQISVKILSSAAVSLSWLPPKHANGSITEYRVQCSHSEALHGLITGVTQHLNHTFSSGFWPLVSYRCCVSATNSTGNGPQGCTAVFWTNEAAPLGTPQNIELRPLNATALAISWRPPPHNTTNGIVTAYTLRITELESGETKEVERESYHRELVVTSLHADYRYNVSVSSNTSAGEGPFSPPVGTRLLQDVPAGPPLNVAVSSVSTSSVVLSWKPPPKEDQNGRITGYRLATHQGTEPLKRMEAAEDQHSIVVGGLTGNTHYELQVAAKTHVGTGPYSAPVHIKTKINVLQAGIYSSLVITTVCIFFPSLITCILVISCYKTDNPCCSKQQSTSEKTASMVPGFCREVNLFDVRYEKIKAEKQEEESACEIHATVLDSRKGCNSLAKPEDSANHVVFKPVKSDILFLL